MLADPAQRPDLQSVPPLGAHADLGLAREGQGVSFQLNGQRVLALAAGALFLPHHRALLVADMHWEKGSSLARFGSFAPPFDTRATLIRLAALIEEWQPALVVSMGDAFHDPQASQRLDAADRALICRLTSAREWVWLCGNHDPDPPADLGGVCRAHMALGALNLRHEPLPGPQPGEVAGHLHPAARVAGRAGSVRRACFLTDGARCILPSFGAFTGGLSVLDPAFTALGLQSAQTCVLMLGRNLVQPVGMQHVVG